MGWELLARCGKPRTQRHRAAQARPQPPAGTYSTRAALRAVQRRTRRCGKLGVSMPKPGTTSLFTEELAHRLAGHVRKGVGMANAALLEGISPATFKAWCKKGEEGLHPYTLIYELCEIAQAELQEELLGCVHRLALGHTEEHPLYTIKEETRNEGDKVITVTRKDFQGMDLKALTWLLERKWPGEFRPPRQDSNVNLSGGIGVGGKFEIVIVDPAAEENDDKE